VVAVVEARDLERLGDYLAALAVPTRLSLLRLLQVPRPLSEVKLPPTRQDGGRRPDRPISREVGLVTARPSRREGRPVTEFVVDHARLFAVVEELRLLSLIRPAGGFDVTVIADDRAEVDSPASPPGPAVITTNGPRAGQTFALAGEGPWLIGRAREAEISLPHDPFVSSRHALLHRGWALEPLPGARNGATLNWRAIDGRTSVAAGDCIGVGRTLLVVRGL
jgi:hypothetical protein